jgi:hypothetical protein
LQYRRDLCPNAAAKSREPVACTSDLRALPLPLRRPPLR